MDPIQFMREELAKDSRVVDKSILLGGPGSGIKGHTTEHPDEGDKTTTPSTPKHHDESGGYVGSSLAYGKVVQHGGKKGVVTATPKQGAKLVTIRYESGMSNQVSVADVVPTEDTGDVSQGTNKDRAPGKIERGLREGRRGRLR